MTDPPKFDRLPSEEQDWIDAYVDGTIEPEAFDRLQERMLESSELRSVMRDYLGIDAAIRDELASEPQSATGEWQRTEDANANRKPLRFPSLLPVAAAAAVAFLLGSASMHWFTKRDAGTLANAPATPDEDAPSAQGFAVIGRLFDATWPAGLPPHSEGDVLADETFQLASGTAEIQFFSGANMTVEGPAEIALKSAWEASCVEGAVRMQVPPAARGFKLQAPSTEIVDLGTEFGLQVRGGEAKVEVFDGEIEVMHRGANKKLVTKGFALGLPKDGEATPQNAGETVYPDAGRFDSQSQQRLESELARSEAHRRQLAADSRLIAYYRFDQNDPAPLVPNLADTAAPDTDGAVILAEAVDGRVTGVKSALEFRRPGARVRVNIPGEFPAFTFAAWVRIDSLDRQYSALFMGDSYENGEPHWQIRDDGKMMLSVMVDDQRQHPKWAKSRYHEVYFSPPVWDLSMSGQWLHLASVFDPAGQEVSHYVNGQRVAREEIDPLFRVETLRIGNAEIGNWGQPFREDPSFAIRNLNGRMDEIAIFKSALGDDEISDLFKRSRPGSH